jgi:glutaredoxin 3
MERDVVEIYGMNDCPWCVRAKELCQRHGYRFEYLDMTDNAALRIDFVSRTPSGTKTVPQIFVGTRHIGGCTDLITAHESGLLQQLLGGN